jgi:hypothetical protein
MLAMGWIAFLVPEPFVRVGALLIALAAIYVSCQLFVRTRIHARKSGQAIAIHSEYRSELERQSEALLSVWRWYLLPFVPGVIVFIVGVAFAPSSGMSILESIGFSAKALGFAAIVLGFVWLLNVRAARMLLADIRSLDSPFHRGS